MNKEGEALFEDSDQYKLLPRQIIVLLGAHNISKNYEIGRIVAPVQKIIIHDDWSSTVINYDADIAMLILEEEVHLSRYVKPICLPQGWASEMLRDSYVAGWGLSEDTADPSVPKMNQAPVVDNRICFQRKSELSKISSGRTFCAGTADGAGVCLGDSGHGLFSMSNDVFYLNGIVSSSLLSFGGVCDVSTYAIFTNVVKHVDWITNLMFIT